MTHRIHSWPAALGLAAILCGVTSCDGPPPEGDVARNVLLVSIDTCRADHLGAYGSTSGATPTLDALARRGVVFENAYSPSPMTLPAHSTMLTGTLPPFHGVRANIDYRLGESAVTLAEVLGQEGFATAAFVGSAIMGAQFGLHQGFDTYDDPVPEAPAKGSSLERACAETTATAVEWLAEHRDERLFLFVHYFDPHYPYAPPEPFASRHADDPYMGEIASVDRCIGDLLEGVERLGLLESTLIALTGDHGEMLGDHGENTHGFTIYESAIRVPLILVPPAADREHRISEPAGLIDLPRTLCAGVGVSPPQDLGGENLFGYLAGSDPSREERAFYAESVTPMEYGANPLLGIVAGRFKLVDTTRPELYDLTQDPREEHDLAPEHPEHVEKLRESLRAVLARSRRQAPEASDSGLDEPSRQRLEALGYVSGGKPRGEPAIEPGRPDPKDLVEFHRAYGTLLALRQEGRLEEAWLLGRRMLEQRPDYAEGHRTVAEIAGLRGDRASEERHLRLALELEPCSARTHLRLGLVLRARGDLDGAMERFRRAVECDPAYPEAHGLLGLALFSRGRTDEAAAHFRRVIEIDPGDVTAHLHLGNVMAAEGKLEEAIARYREALRLDPGNARAHQQLGVALHATGQSAEGLEHLRAASRAKPDWPAPLIASAWILASGRDAGIRAPDEAIRLAQRACDLTRRQDPEALDALAATYAAADRFEEAESRAGEAVELATAMGMDRLAGEIRRRLDLYRQRQPYREPDRDR